MAIYHTFLFGGRGVVVKIPYFPVKGNGCGHGQIPCSPFDRGGLMVVVMAIYHTFLFGGREVVVVVTPSFSGIGSGCDHGQIPFSPLCP